jgi:hypothetical protein
LSTIEVHPLDAHLRAQACAFARQHWGAERIVSRGRLHEVRDLEGLVACT